MSVKSSSFDSLSYETINDEDDNNSNEIKHETDPEALDPRIQVII